MKVAQPCPTLCDPVDYTVRGILQAGILELGSRSLLQGIFSNPGIEPASLLSLASAGGFFFFTTSTTWASPVVQLVKNPPATPETLVQSLGWEDPLEKGKDTLSSILA